jgi:alpha-L-fucosidase 2
MTMKRALFVLTLLACTFTAYAQKQQQMTLWYNRPAQYFEESLPIGNGKLGALIYGGTEQDKLQLNDITLWTGQPVDRDEDAGASKWIPEIRKALFNEDYRLADSLQLHVQGHNSQYYQPLATLLINDYNRGQASNYHRQLSLDSAICKTTFMRDGVRYEREYWASNPDKMIAIRLTADRKESLNVGLALTSLVPHKVKASQNQLTMTGHATGDADNSIHYCTIMKVVNRDGSVQAVDSTLQLTGVSEAIVYIVNETSFNGYDKHPVRQGADYINLAADDAWHLVNYSYEQLRDRHVADYRQFFTRVELNLDGAAFNNDVNTEQMLKNYTDLKGNKPSGNNRYLETLYFQYGRYLLISSSRTPGVPANLQGLWTPHLWSPWRGNYTVNINLEENYWPAFTANLAEMAMPLDGFVNALADNGRHTARNYYGITRGWCSSHNSDIWAMTNPVGEKNEKPEWANWNLGGAWLVNTLWERYQFTQDKTYLKTTALPLMRGATDFCMDWLIDNPKQSGELITAPSTSPENEYVTDKGYHGMTCYGGTADLAIIRELFINTSLAEKTLFGTSQGSDKIQEKLQRLHPYTIGHMGDLNEWYYDWDDFDFQHRHQSHLIGLYPGSHLTLNGTPELAQACRRSLEIKGDKTTGWSTGWRINLWARLHDSQQAYHIYQKLLTYVSPDAYRGPDRRRSGGTYPNLFDAHPPFQIDGNFGGTAGVCEMLMQSVLTGTDVPIASIELLPALPEAWNSGSVKGLCARGGYEVDFEWKDGKVVSATIHSKCGGKVNVFYNGKQKRLNLKKGKQKTIR